MGFIKMVFCGLLFCANILFAFAENIKSENETNELKYILSFDTGLTLTALRNLGYGIGINYERKLTDFLSFKPGFGHMVCFSDITAVTVNLQLFLNYYPLSNGLDKLYIGIGNGCDFIMYPGKDNTLQDTAISLTPLLGWKWKALKNLMVEPFLGWKFYILSSNNNKNVKNYLNEGFQWGLKLNIFLPNKNN